MFYVCQLVMGQTQPEGINTTGQKKRVLSRDTMKNIYSDLIIYRSIIKLLIIILNVFQK